MSNPISPNHTTAIYDDPSPLYITDAIRYLHVDWNKPAQNNIDAEDLQRKIHTLESTVNRLAKIVEDMMVDKELGCS